MKFAVPEVYRQLERTGSVYTVRDYKVGKTGSIRVPGIGWCVRKYIGEADNLDNVVAESGFSSVFEWKATIRKFIPDNKPKYLYLIKVTEREVK